MKAATTEYSKGILLLFAFQTLFGCSGGGGDGDPLPTGATDVSTASEPPWATKSPMPTARYDLVVGVVNDKIYAIGGTQFSNGQFLHLQIVEEYDPATDTWTTKSPIPTPRGEAAGAVVNGKIYIIGGYETSNLTAGSNKVEVYEPAQEP